MRAECRGHLRQEERGLVWRVLRRWKETEDSGRFLGRDEVGAGRMSSMGQVGRPARVVRFDL